MANPTIPILFVLTMLAIDLGASIFPAAFGQVVPVAGYGRMYALAGALLAVALVLYTAALSARSVRRGEA